MNRGQNGTLQVRETLFFLLSLGMLTGPVALAQAPQNAPSAPNAVPEISASEQKRPAPDRRMKLTNIKGKVASVDPASGSMKIKEGVKERAKEHTVSLTDKTVVTAGKVKKSIADIKPGDKIVARVLEEDGRMTARSIRIAQEGKKGGRESAPEANRPGAPDDTAKPADPSDAPKNETPASPESPETAP